MVMPVTLRRYTVDEIDAFPPDGNRYELLDGVLFVSPAPGLAHGIVVFALGAIFREFLAPEVGAFVAGPGVVELRPSLRMEPDVLVGRLGTGTGSGWDRVAERWLAIEVSGSGSRIYDRDYKRTSYLAVGIPEVWRVELEARKLFRHRAGEDECEVGDRVLWRSPGSGRELEVRVADLFTGLPD
ncbi:MAG: Uma2 family endonuclease [Gemmatimonadetes bacterium]|nr:Uma2 family endonuclease [Gemmatimonadota bacterium]